MLSETLSIDKKRDTQMMPEAKQENWSQPVYVPTSRRSPDSSNRFSGYSHILCSFYVRLYY